jgi:hypothetical protein
MRADPACRTATAVTLAPVLAFCLWCNVIAGSGAAWNAVQPGQRSLAWVLAGFAFSALLPVVVLVAMVRLREHAHGGGIVNRALRIEKWGLLVGLPLTLVALIPFAAGSVI